MEQPSTAAAAVNVSQRASLRVNAHEMKSADELKSNDVTPMEVARTDMRVLLRVGACTGWGLSRARLPGRGWMVRVDGEGGW